MNLLEATKLMDKGFRVRRQSWVISGAINKCGDKYHYVSWDDGSALVLTTEDILADDYEIVEAEVLYVNLKFYV